MICYVFGQKKINKIIKDLICENNGIYLNPINYEKWLLTCFWSEMLEVKLNFLEKLPQCSSSILIENLSLDKSMEELLAISLAIYNRNFDNIKSNRTLLIEKIELFFSKREDNNSLSKIKNIIYETAIYDSTNRDSIINKDPEQIRADYQFYEDISNRAKEILAFRYDFDKAT